MYKFRIRGDVITKGSERRIARTEIHQMTRQGLHTYRGPAWALCRNDDGDYSLRYATLKETKTYPLELV